jgi:hypothetical protein
VVQAVRQNIRQLDGSVSQGWFFREVVKVECPLTTPQHSFTRSDWCLCLREIVARLLLCTYLFKTDLRFLSTGRPRTGALPAETPASMEEELWWMRPALADASVEQQKWFS